MRMEAGRWCVSMQGRLLAPDLGRLEHACARALEQRPAPLNLDVDGLTAIDESSRLFLRRLIEHGARLTGRRGPAWDARIVGKNLRKDPGKESER